MHKWEYATLGLINSYGLQYKLNNEKEHKWKDKPLNEVLADLGELGWEFITFDGENYIFKRPKAEAGQLQKLGAPPGARPVPGTPPVKPGGGHG